MDPTLETFLRFLVEIFMPIFPKHKGTSTWDIALFVGPSHRRGKSNLLRVPRSKSISIGETWGHVYGAIKVPVMTFYINVTLASKVAKLKCIFIRLEEPHNVFTFGLYHFYKVWYAIGWTFIRKHVVPWTIKGQCHVTPHPTNFGFFSFSPFFFNNLFSFFFFLKLKLFIYFRVWPFAENLAAG